MWLISISETQIFSWSLVAVVMWEHAKKPQVHGHHIVKLFHSFLCTFAMQIWKLLCHVSISLSSCISWIDFHKIWYLWVLLKFVSTFQFWIKLDNSSRHFTWRPTYFCLLKWLGGNLQFTLVTKVTFVTLGIAAWGILRQPLRPRGESSTMTSSPSQTLPSPHAKVIN